MMKFQLLVGTAFFIGILHVSGLVKLPFVDNAEPVLDTGAKLDLGGASDDQLVAKVQLKATSTTRQMVAGFVGAVNGTGVNVLLQPQQIANDPGLKSSDKVLSRVKNVIAKFEEVNYDRINDLRHEIDRLEIDRDMKDNLMTSVNFHYGGGGAFRKMLKAQERVVYSMADVVDFLKDTEGRWSYRSNALKFDRESDSQLFVARMEQMHARERELMKFRQSAQR